MKKNIIILLMAIALVNPVQAERLVDQAEDRFISACKIARSKFLDRLAEESKYEWKHQEYASNIENYSIGFSETQRLFIFVFKIKGDEFVGGNTIYYINKETLEIEKEMTFK